MHQPFVWFHDAPHSITWGIMRWEDQRESENVEDRRGMGPVGGTGLGIGGIILVLAISYFTGTNPLTILNMLGGIQEMVQDSEDARSAPTDCPSDRLANSPSAVLAGTE